MTCLNIAYITTTIALITYVNASEKLSSITSLSTSPLLAELMLYNEYSNEADQATCACQTKYELLDMGQTSYPRFLVNAVCQNNKNCKEIPYKVRVLTHRSENDLLEMDDPLTTLPESLIMDWKFKKITVVVACQCAN